MKIFLYAAFLILLIVTPLKAQNCSRFYPMNEGTTFQYTSYNKKGKKEGVADYQITKVSDNASSTTATMQISYTDEKGKELFNTDYSFTCEGNKVSIDYESLIPSKMFEQYEGMEMEISGTDIELPNDLEVGKELPDANVSLTISMGGMNMTTTVDMVNRKVEKKETVTTTAGTYDCYVVYSENETKMMMAKQSFPSRLWLAEEVGMVKQESYNKKGDLITSTLLTSFNQ